MRPRRILFTLLPTLAFVALVETGMRVGEWAAPSLFTVPFEESSALFRIDPDLFWSLRPSLDVQSQGARIRTNSLGLRARAIGKKSPGETRILSLGESSTFGVGVDARDTYGAVLERELNRDTDPRKFTRVINAGVSVYSSFQSLKYLELRGHRLEPDWILFYHELNDYLPSSLRSGSTEIGISRTDKELYDSNKNRLRRLLRRYAATYRFLELRLARFRIERFQAEGAEIPPDAIGLPDFAMLPRVVAPGQDGFELAGLDEKTLPRRVSREERRWVLAQLLAFARARGIGLTLIHPSYRDSAPHRCVLTEFAESEGLAPLDAHPILHPPDHPADAFYLDVWHPNAAGHQRLGMALAKFLQGQEAFRTLAR